jgi:hypothetical protein
MFRRLSRQALVFGLLGAGTIRIGAQAQDRPIDLWRNLRDALTSDTGAAYFKQVHGAEIPVERKMFDGTVVSQSSQTTLIVNVDNPAGDGGLMVRHTLKGIAPGTLVHFRGVIESYTKEPYMLKLWVDDEDVAGLGPK